MNTKSLTIFATVAVAALGFAGVVDAQRGTMKMDTTMKMDAMMPMMRDCPMMRGATEGPSAVLGRREALGLTNSQVTRLEVIEQRTREARSGTMERMQSVHQDLARLADSERFDEPAVRRAFSRMGELHADVGVALLRARHETRAVLTPGQREKLAQVGAGGMNMRGMQGMMGAMRGHEGGMMDMSQCPMMQDMMRNGMGDSTSMPKRSGGERGDSL